LWKSLLLGLMIGYHPSEIARSEKHTLLVRKCRYENTAHVCN